MIWAEDGNIFISSALEHGGFTSLFKPYAGYLHFFPRIAASVVVNMFDVANYASAMTVLACLAVAAVSLMTFYCSDALTDALWVRAAWAGIPILVNVGAVETLGNFANLHWYLLWLTPWLLLKHPRSALEGTLLGAAAAAVSLTEIIAIVFLPLMLFRFKNKAYWYARLGLLGGLGCQLYTTLTYPRPSGSDYDVNPVSLLLGWAINTAGPIFYGNARTVLQLVLTYGNIPLLLAALVLAGIIVLAFSLGSPHERLMVALFTSASAIVYTACVIANRSIFFDYAIFDNKDWLEYFSFTRYSVVPTMFTLAIVPALALTLKRKISGSQPLVLTAFFLLLTTMYFIPGTNRDGGPLWAEQVNQARSVCDSDQHSTVVLKVSPHFYDGDMVLTCDVLKAPKK